MGGLENRDFPNEPDRPSKRGNRLIGLRNDKIGPIHIKFHSEFFFVGHFCGGTCFLFSIDVRISYRAQLDERPYRRVVEGLKFSKIDMVLVCFPRAG